MTSAGQTVPIGSPPYSRRDIQGLRALAVVAVILDHLLGCPRGGFVGVDVFFVISGFLITGHLLREYAQTGRLPFAAFYRRRARRILPVSTVVLAVTVAAGFALYLTARAQGILYDAAFAVLFAANWHFAADGTDYWADDGTLSPVQHYWSLAVEEQFYLVWPLLIALVLGLATARGRGPATRTLFAAMTLIVGGSFAWAIVETLANPTWAYFSTFSRAWELGVGGLLAIAARSCARIPGRWRAPLAWAGLAGIVTAVFLIDEGAGFPAPVAALPVLATALVIAAGTGGDLRLLLPLTNRVSTYLGDISYSLYLWHFPAVVLLGALFPRGPVYIAVAATATLALSVASYHLVETPVRTSTWLEPSPGPRSARSRLRRQQHVAERLRYFAAFLVVSACAVLVVVSVVVKAQVPARDVRTPSTDEVTSRADDPELALEAAIGDALRKTSYPEFVPAIDTLGTQNWLADVERAGCADVLEVNADDCVFGARGSDLTAVVLGDSFGMAWMPAVRAALEPLGYEIHQLTRGQCPVADVDVFQDETTPFPDCGPYRTWALREVATLEPDLVLVGDSLGTLGRLASRASGDTAAGELEEGYAESLAALEDAAAETVVLASPPEAPALQACVTRIGTPADCETRLSRQWRLFTDAQRAASEATGATMLDTSTWFCDAYGSCPGFVGTTPVRADTGHLTREYSSSLGPVLAQGIESELALAARSP